MKIAIIGQQDFGKAVLEAFLARGDEVAGVFCAPEKEGRKARSAARRGAGEGLRCSSSSRCAAPEATRR
jgi:methionyl-tRNA formyltransferase